MRSFEDLLREHRSAVERLVRFQTGSAADGDDILQEVYLTAFRKFSQLREEDSFKPWLLAIARSKCRDHYRRLAARSEVSLEAAGTLIHTAGRRGPERLDAVWETLEQLGPRDREVLLLCFRDELPQSEIARRLGIPLGTVKSRLHAAKGRFRDNYPYPPVCKKGEHIMKHLPDYLPEYAIQWSQEPPFPVKWEELMGWFLVPRLGEKLVWGMYDMPSRRCSNVCAMAVTGPAVVHGIQGVELTAHESPCPAHGIPLPIDQTADWAFVAQLTDTHCRYLAAQHMENGVKHYDTFLDGDAFLPNWGFGENNCGNEVNLQSKGDILRQGSSITTAGKEFLLDVVGRCAVTIGGRTYDTVCVMDVETYNSGVVSEQFLDKNGRTILWRRFNRNDWAADQYGGLWTELLPDNERLSVNGVTYVHWYDCVTDYIL